MKKFLIQTIDGVVKHDFSFHLLEAVRYANWIRNEEVYSVTLTDKINDNQRGYAPVGTLEFVFSYMEKYHDFEKGDFVPINLPRSLMKTNFLKRDVRILEKKEIFLDQPLFLKSNTKYKSFTDVAQNLENVPEDTYLVSEVVEIHSEWRSFVYGGKLVGLQNYAGDFTVFPCIETLKEMIDSYDDAPPAYTLDVAVNESGSFLIEVHPFISCGLYGFSDYKVLPEMFISAFNWQVKLATPILKKEGKI